MINHYNAFISYKHAPEDNKVAEAIHKGLERFHIPGKIRKKTGIKRISRIFRDKDELPITNDLSDTIASALENSDYLIVICSTNTKQSAWVPREIEYFLKNHTKREIFTVLVNGEPYDVIPEILLYEDREVKDEKGNEQTVRIPMEPLSCDYRLPAGKAKRTELPRLASGLIGCSYDELMNRHRQYRLKQLTAVFSTALAVMVGFSGYMYYSRDKIRKTYLESLKNQSLYLANESGSLLEKEQRITALQLALTALPQDENDERPVTAAAVRALTDATLAYQTDMGTNINAAWNYQLPNAVDDFCVSEDGSHIAAYDSGSVVGAWDTESHERFLYLDDVTEEVQGIRFIADGNLLVWSSHAMTCYSVAAGEKLWEYEAGENWLRDSDNLCVSEEALYIGAYDNVYLKLDPATGKLTETIPFEQKSGYEDFSIVESVLSPDGKKIAFRGMVGWNDYAYGVMDLTSKTITLSEPLKEMVKDIAWIGDDALMVASTKVDMSGSMSLGESDIISSDHSTIRCLSGSDLSEKWTADFVCNGVMIQSGFLGLSNGEVAYFSGNVISVYELATGKLKYNSNVNDPVIDVSDRDGDGTPLYITENGGYATPALSVDEDAVYYKPCFADELRQVTINKGVYVRRARAHEVIYYGSHVYDEAWTALSDALITGTISQSCLDDELLAILSGDDSGVKLDVFSLKGEGGHFQSSLPGENTYDYVLLGVYDGKVYLGSDGEKYTLVTVDGESGKVSSDELFVSAGMFNRSCSLVGGKLVYCERNDDYETFVTVMDLASGEKSENKLTDEIGYLSAEPLYYEEDGIILLQGDTMGILDVKTGKISLLESPEDFGDAVCCSDKSDKGAFAVSDGKQILLSESDGGVKASIRCPGVSPMGVTFLPEGLAVLYSDGNMNLYDAGSGEFKKNIDVSVYSSYNGDVSFDIDEENELMYIQMDKLTDVIDLESGVEIACISESFGHHKGRDIFITSSKASNEGDQIGFYKRYTVQELIEKGRDILQNAELSQEIRSRYGIE
ncbi:MAG: TIR domain-containing protein [Lachnospiraceae bacterium]|nr:TIR domain-containing protein [Lachnospiraceae bacterium]